MAGPEPVVRADAFFCLRTPLLPHRVWLDWGEGLEAPRSAMDRITEALDHDRHLLRARLREWMTRPEIMEALYVASPDLVESLGRWHTDPDSTKGRRVEAALVRYFARMCHRTTPFGLFAGVTTGTSGTTTCLTLPSKNEWIIRSRLDTGVLCALAERLQEDSVVRERLLYQPNNSLYACGGRLRYGFARNQKGERIYQLAAIGTNEAMEKVLGRANGGATLADLTAVLVAEGYPESEARVYVHQLAQEQILVADLEPEITGNDTLASCTSGFTRAAVGHAVDGPLAEAQTILMELQGPKLGKAFGHFTQVRKVLAPLADSTERFVPWRVDLFKPCSGVTFGPEFRKHLQEGLHLLWRLATLPASDPLKSFREAFRNYFDQRWVPLAEALDPEFGPSARVGRIEDPSTGPLFGGRFGRIPLAAEEPEGNPTATRRDLYLSQRISQLRERNETILELTGEDLEALKPVRSPQLPRSFVLAAEIAAPSVQAFQKGDYQIFLQGTLGPSAARMLGRFCHGDPQLLAHLREHLRAEEDSRPEAVFAEIVHLPSGPMGNILARPVLREHEIPYLGRAGVTEAQRIPVQDLLLGLVGERLVLWSRSLDREVVPRLSSAANYFEGGSRLFRFLCGLQDQGVWGCLEFRWGALLGEPFLPRVTMGRFVLARAQWLLDKKERVALAGASTPDARYRAFQDLRRTRRWPRCLVYQDEDHQLPVDLDNVLSLEALWGVLRNRDVAILREDFPGAAAVAVQGPEGAYNGELLVPFLAEQRMASEPFWSPMLEERTLFGPGSEWLYWRIYTGGATADRLLEGPLAQLIEDLMASGEVDRWFFLRYADPEPHLRFRFHGEPTVLCATVLPRVHRTLDPLVRTGWIRRFNVDTYEPETARYGGGQNLPDVERLFQADSEAVLRIIAAIPGDEAPDRIRWPLGLVSADQWLESAGFPMPQRLDLLESFRSQAIQGSGGSTGDLRRWLGDRFRAERPSLERLFHPSTGHTGPLDIARSILGERTGRCRPILMRVRQRLETDAYPLPLADLLASLMHMGLNRLLRTTAHGEEIVVIDFLARIYKSMLRRPGLSEKARPVPVPEVRPAAT